MSKERDYHDLSDLRALVNAENFTKMDLTPFLSRSPGSETKIVYQALKETINEEVQIALKRTVQGWPDGSCPFGGHRLVDMALRGVLAKYSGENLVNLFRASVEQATRAIHGLVDEGEVTPEAAATVLDCFPKLK